MSNLSELLHRVENLTNLDVTVQAHHVDGTYHARGGCPGDGKYVVANLLAVLAQDSLCPECGPRLICYTDAYLDIPTIQYLHQAHQYINEEHHLPVHERFRWIGNFMEDTQVPQADHPAPTWLKELRQEALVVWKMLRDELKSTLYKELAVQYAWGSAEDKQKVHAAFTGSLLPQPGAAYRAALPGKAAEAYIQRQRTLEMVAESLRDNRPLYRSGLETTLVSVPDSLLSNWEAALMATSHHITTRSYTSLVQAPKVVADVIVEAARQAGPYHKVKVSTGLIPDDRVDAIGSLWDPLDPLFGNLDRLAEAANLIR